MESSGFLERVRQYGRAHGLWHRGDRILAAVSGGPDSLGLLLTLHALQKEEGFFLASCVVNHHLRMEAAEEAAFVKKVSADLSVPCVVKEVDVPGYRKIHGESVETAARELRYQALYEAARDLGCGLIALAHHKGDQAETVLAHLLRGSGLTGLSGMRPCLDGRIRPFLCVTKEEILDFLKAFPYAYCHDATNDVPDATRNKIRLTLLPLLQRYNPQIAGSLCRTAEILGEEDRYMEQAAETALRETGWDGTSFGLDTFGTFPLAMRRRMLRMAWEKSGGRVLSFEDMERMLDFLRNTETGRRTSAAGIILTLSYGRGYLARGSTRNGLAKGMPDEERWTLAIDIRDEKPAAGENQLVLDADAVGQIQLRTRQTGDRFAPKGMEGTKLLTKYMKELQIPREERDRWPLAADGDRIYWICGKRVSRYGAPTTTTKRFMILTLRRT